METYEVSPVAVTWVCLSAEWADEDGGLPVALQSEHW